MAAAWAEAEPKAGPKAEPKAESNEEDKEEATAEAKEEAKPEPKTQAIAEPKTTAKVEAKAETMAESEGRLGNRGPRGRGVMGCEVDSGLWNSLAAAAMTTTSARDRQVEGGISVALRLQSRSNVQPGTSLRADLTVALGFETWEANKFGEIMLEMAADRTRPLAGVFSRVKV